MKSLLSFAILTALSASAFAAEKQNQPLPDSKDVLFYCFEKTHKGDLGNDHGMQAMIGKFGPKQELEITVADMSSHFPIIDSEKVKEKKSKAIGSAISYKGASYLLSMNFTVTPVIEEGRAYAPSSLATKNYTVEMKCRASDAQ